MKQQRDDKNSCTSQSDNTDEMTEQEIKNALNLDQIYRLNALLNLLENSPLSTHILTAVMSDEKLSTEIFHSIGDLGKITEKHPQLKPTLIEHLLSNTELLKSIIKKTQNKIDLISFVKTDPFDDKTNENKLAEFIKQNPGVITNTRDFF